MTDIKAEDLSLLSAAGKELHRLHEKATAAPWEYRYDDVAGVHYVAYGICVIDGICVIVDRAWATIAAEDETTRKANAEESKANAQIIAAARNLLPELLLEMAELGRRLEELQPLADAQKVNMEIMTCGHSRKNAICNLPGNEGCALCDLEAAEKRIGVLESALKLIQDQLSFDVDGLDGDDAGAIKCVRIMAESALSGEVKQNG